LLPPFSKPISGIAATRSGDATQKRGTPAGRFGPRGAPSRFQCASANTGCARVEDDSPCPPATRIRSLSSERNRGFRNFGRSVVAVLGPHRGPAVLSGKLDLDLPEGAVQILIQRGIDDRVLIPDLVRDFGRELFYFLQILGIVGESARGFRQSIQRAFGRASFTRLFLA